jgi:hypothetical protein
LMIASAISAVTANFGTAERIRSIRYEIPQKAGGQGVRP